MNSKPKILIVDDKPENLVALRTVLKDLDIELIEATSGNDALKATLRHDFALALLDIQMPEMDGYELASILREEEKTAHLPFIFISAVYTDNFNIFKGYEKGAFSFIAKPFQPEILINKVSYFIDRHLQEFVLFELNKELENKNKELELINKELESFSYSVSHDLRAPLRHINGFVDLLLSRFYDTLPDKARHYLDNIAESSRQMGTLIDDLLQFSRTSRQEMRKSVLNMNNIVEEVLAPLKQDNSQRNIEWRIASLPHVYGDQALLRLVWINLLSNAVKFTRTREKSIIAITVLDEKDEFVFAVADNGVGFDMQYAQKLFGVFQRLHSTDEFEGTGIGLANVHHIILRHGGRTWAEAETDKGATFYFSLPKNKED